MLNADKTASAGNALGSDVVTYLNWLDFRALGLVLGAHSVLLSEMQRAALELAEQMQTEMHISNELVRHMSEAHSVDDLKVAWLTYCQHQFDAFRQFNRWSFGHGERMTTMAARLFTPPPMS